MNLRKRLWGKYEIGGAPPLKPGPKIRSLRIPVKGAR